MSAELSSRLEGLGLQDGMRLQAVRTRVGETQEGSYFLTVEKRRLAILSLGRTTGISGTATRALPASGRRTERGRIELGIKGCWGH